MLPKIIKPCGTNNQTMCPFTVLFLWFPERVEPRVRSQASNFVSVKNSLTH